MSYKKLEQAKVLEQVKQRIIMQAAARLSISERWVDDIQVGFLDDTPGFDTAGKREVIALLQSIVAKKK